MTRAAILPMHGGVGLAAGAMPADQMVEQRAGRRLAALAQPQPGSATPKYGPQTPSNERGSVDIAMTQLDVPAISARWRSIVARSPVKPASAPSAPA